MKVLALVISILAGFSTLGQTVIVKSDEVRVQFLTVAQKTSGTIGGFKAQIEFDAQAPENSKISGSVDVSSLETGNKMRDKHLKSDDFFDLENFPVITFESSFISKTEEGYMMVGSLTIEDRTNTENIKFTFKEKTFRGEMTISMANYDLGMFSQKKGDKSNVTIKFILPVE